MLVALLSLVGVALGALLQHVLSRSRETEKQLALLRDAAYADYLQGITDAKFAEDNDAHVLALRKATAAKARIAIYAPSAVLAALADFERVSRGNLGSHRKEFAKLVAKMRGNELTSADVEVVLFGVDIEDSRPS